MKISGRMWRALLLVFLLLGAAAFVAVRGILPRVRAREILARETTYRAAPVVTVVHPKLSSPGEEIVLPGSIQAFVDAPIYARTSGYLKSWKFDIGARVKQGQILAEIESPEVDQQLQQAREDLDTAKANLKLAQITASRYSTLFQTDSVAKQDVDNAVQDAAAKQAIVKSAQANVGRMEQMVGFEKVVAPFDGVVTARNTDIGQLVEAGSSASAARELFHVADITKLRVFINVPQVYSHEAVPGVKASLTLPEEPQKQFQGTIVRTADAFDQATRTLLVEVDVVNTSGLLLPGAYAQVHFKVSSKAPALLIPPTALIFRAEGLRAATVAADHAVLLPVTLGRDFGTEVEVIDGLSSNSLVIVNPPDSLVNGEAVRIVSPSPPKQIEE
ncbi:MAG TPA: efflux RND transporter periplasmic adaptor subunit [Bryobacteraceae bacterium]|jgi:RND family efflux transporter MFP subunit|nr:efflux RND transporter periplasmic adaptor subunit [Bryobacteraceae bacterium]